MYWSWLLLWSQYSASTRAPILRIKRSSCPHFTNNKLLAYEIYFFVQKCPSKIPPGRPFALYFILDLASLVVFYLPQTRDTDIHQNTLQLQADLQACGAQPIARTKIILKSNFKKWTWCYPERKHYMTNLSDHIEECFSSRKLSVLKLPAVKVLF